MAGNWRTKAEYLEAKKQRLRELTARLLEIQEELIELGCDSSEVVCHHCGVAINLTDAFESEIERVGWLILDLYKKNSPTIGENYGG